MSTRGSICVDMFQMAAATCAGVGGGEGRKERPPITLPAVPSSFPEVAGLPIDELNRLLTDEVAFDMLLLKLQQVKVR